MSSSVYSTRLFSLRVGTSPVPYTAASDFRTVLRDLLLVQSTSVFPLQVAVEHVNPAGTYSVFYFEDSSSPTAFVQWQGRLVMDQGDQLVFTSADAILDISGYGYQLGLP